MPKVKTWTVLASALVGLVLISAHARAEGDATQTKDGAPQGPVSFVTQIRPIFQAKCQGCHQPAKAGGDYVMTVFDRLLKGGEMGVEAVVPGKPKESYLVDQIRPDKDGKVLMPKGKPALAEAEIELIERWIAEGAKDDTPENAVALFDKDHPPVYTRPPVIPAIAFSPDGQLLAVAGFHEVLLWKADGSERVARLVGLSQRVESLAFSPDGKKLAVTGGLPGRMGEVQIWDVAKRTLTLSVPVTYDTLFGASWSPDGSKVAFGAADHSVRAINAETGEQVLFMGSHDDWVLDTVFSHDGSHVISVGRDMTAKLTELETQRFIDNITSITPGALKGGLGAVARHPLRDEIVVGGSDGVPKLYRVFRETARKIGDDANLIRQFDPMRGRVQGVDVSADGKLIAAGSGIDGAGEVHVYSYDFDTKMPEDIKKIESKRVMDRNAQEVQKLTAYLRDSVKVVSKAEIPTSIVYAVSLRPDGKIVAAAGSDGQVRLINSADGQVQTTFSPAPVTGEGQSAANEVVQLLARPEEPALEETETLPRGSKLVSIEVEPATVHLNNKFAYSQLLVFGTLDSGDRVDVTRMVERKLDADLVNVTPTGLVTPKADGHTLLKLSLNGQTAEVPIDVANVAERVKADFIRDVNPVMSRMGCNQGTCHGSAKGKNGFKLSLRGYDPIFDVRALTDEHASRRVNIASPDASLMLLKTTGAVPHVGGSLTKPGEPYYEIIRRWVADGARLDLDSPRVAKIEITPSKPVVQALGSQQQVRVMATYADGQVRDVTREAFVESGNTEVATAGRTGLMTAVRRGEAPILARFEGAYAATTLTVMGDRTGFEWNNPPTYGRIDELVAAKWKRLKIQPSGLCSDAEFVRRVYLDLTGLPPTPEQVRAFLDDPAESRARREALVDTLIGTPQFVDYWTNKWADLLQVNRKYLGTDGSSAFRGWIREQVDRNVPYDQFVRTILTASGSNRENPAASYFKILRDPDATMENTTQLFLAIRFNCNKCHDHPFERWTQDQYYETAAYFARVGLKADPESKDRKIGGTAVEGAKPLYEEVFDKPQGDVTHVRTGKVAPPEFPFSCDYSAPEDATRRQELAAWLTSGDNPYFAMSYVNRLWGYLLGVGIIEPLDDIRAGNPPTNPELLNYLTEEFLKSGFDARHVMRLICKSRTYQLEVASTKWNEDDKSNYSHATARRLPAEVLYDAVYRVTGATSKIPGVPPGTRAAALPDSGVELPSGFFTTFGRPARESSCECERSSGLQLGPVMALVSGPTVAEAIADPNNALTRMTSREADNRKLVNELFLRILNRPATDGEIEACLGSFEEVQQDHQKLAERLGQAEAEFAIKRPQLERERQAAIAQAQAELSAYEKELAPRVAEAEKARQKKIAQAVQALKDFEAKDFEAKLAAWEKKQTTAVQWRALEPKAMVGPKGTTFAPQPDGSILVEGETANGVFTIRAETDLTGVTGVRIEVLPDDRQTSKGVGRGPDGNFVLNEFEVLAAPRANPKAAKPVKLEKPQADFSQQNFPIAQAIDGQPKASNNGWAVSPATNVVHWATFETAQPIGQEGGTMLTFRLHHNYSSKTHQIGRFRLSLTTLPKPVALGVAEPLRQVLEVVPELRTQAQKDLIVNYHKAVDGDWRAKATAVAEARAPLPADPKLQVLKQAVEEAKKPIPVPSELVQLRQDVEMSITQSMSRRLTAAQDIAWALINSPAFLFNH